MRRGVTFLVMLLFIPQLHIFSHDLTTSQIPLTAQLIIDNLDHPMLVTAPSEDDRLFVVLQSGEILIIHPDSSVSTFLDITDRVEYDVEEELGLLSMVFHPDYEFNGYFFVKYVGISNLDVVVSRFEVSPNPDSSDKSSEVVFFSWDRATNSHHNGGMVGFSPHDGYFYVAFGDSRRPNNARDSSSYDGKLLRIDVNQPDSINELPYSIPLDNPFVIVPGALPEIWAIGLRNPWRWSFDPVTGDLFIGDVGQTAYEEIDFQPASSRGGEDYGWNKMEGFHCFPLAQPCDTTGLDLTLPIYEYTHGGDPFQCSVIGGYVYRSCISTEFYGRYIFGDFCAARVWSFTYKEGDTMITDLQDHTADLNLPSGALINSFGRDGFGELYIVDYGEDRDPDKGRVFKIVATDTVMVDCNLNGVNDLCEITSGALQDCNVNGIPDSCDIASGFSLDENNNNIPDECEFCCVLAGDIDSSGAINISDLTFLVDYLFRGGTEPPCYGQGDMDGSGQIDVMDLTYLVDYLFRGGPAPVCPL